MPPPYSLKVYSKLGVFRKVNERKDGRELKIIPGLSFYQAGDQKYREPELGKRNSSHFRQIYV
jgi:hypothetical protein